MEDLRALITMLAVVFAAYLPFYAAEIKMMFYKGILSMIFEINIGYYLIIEGIQAMGGIAISIYFSVRRIEKKNVREPLNLPRHTIRVFLLCNAVISFFLGIFYYSTTHNPEMINLPFLFSMIIGLFTWLWPSKDQVPSVKITKEEKEYFNQKKKFDQTHKYKPWELKEQDKRT